MKEKIKLTEVSSEDIKLNAVLIDSTKLEKENEKLIVGQKVKVTEFSIRNDVGGTEIIHKEDVGNVDIEVLITETWYDYETGEHAKGKLLDKNLIEKVREIGKTGYTPEHYKKYSEKMYEETLEASKNYDPSIAAISEFDLEME